MQTEISSVTTRPHPISNTFHLIMTILTGGLWIPVWIICARGHKVTTRVPVAPYGSVLPGHAAGGFTVAERQYMAAHVPGAARNPDIYAGCSLPSAMLCSVADKKNALAAKYGIEQMMRNDKGRLRLAKLHEMEAAARKIQAARGADA